MLRNSNLEMSLHIAHEPIRGKDSNGNDMYSVDPWVIYAHWKNLDTGAVVLSEEVYSSETLYRALDYVRYRDKDDIKDTDETQSVMTALMDKARSALEDAGMVGPLGGEG